MLSNFSSGKDPLPASTSDSTIEIPSVSIVFFGKWESIISPLFVRDFLEAVIREIVKLSLDGPSSLKERNDSSKNAKFHLSQRTARAMGFFFKRFTNVFFPTMSPA